MFISFRSEGEIREHLDKLLYHIKTNDLGEAGLSVAALNNALFKASTTISIDYDKSSKILKGIQHSLTHFTNPRMRTTRIYDQVRELINVLKTKKNGEEDIKSRIIEVCNDMEKNYDTVCATGDINYFNALCENFMELHELAPDIKKCGHDIYTKYVQMMKDAGTCRALLPRLAPQKIVKGGKPWMARKDTIDGVSGHFTHFFSAVNDFRTSFDKPPSDGKVEGDDQSDIGIDDEQLEVKRAEAVHCILELEWSFPQTSRHLNMTTEDLADLLGIGG